MRAPHRSFALLPVIVWLLTGCGTLPGQPRANSEALAPDQVSDFATLYGENCAGCHGADGRGGAAIPLGDPVYLAIVDKETMRKVVSGGLRSTSMPAFAQSAGGMLTDKQIEVLVEQIRVRWGKPGILQGTTPPSYAAQAPGDAARGEVVYKTFCESCHGAQGRGGPKGSSTVDGSFLAMVPDQELRTMVIVGRPEFGAPDWRGNLAGKPMSEQEITDVVAWLASHRVRAPGQPYSETAAKAAQH